VHYQRDRQRHLRDQKFDLEDTIKPVRGYGRKQLSTGFKVPVRKQVVGGVDAGCDHSFNDCSSLHLSNGMVFESVTDDLQLPESVAYIAARVVTHMISDADDRVRYGADRRLVNASKGEVEILRRIFAEDFIGSPAGIVQGLGHHNAGRDDRLEL
jgi:hypothetical protein